MKKTLLIVVLLGFVKLQGQISLEHSYDNSLSNSVLYSNYSFSFNTESATYYYYFSSGDNSIKLYNENHSLYKSVSLPIPATGYISIYAPSDKLFNNDALIEFIVMISGSTNQMYLLNENGDIINNLGDRNRANIIKTNNGAFKLVTSKNDGNIIDVYALNGTLSTDQFNLLAKLSPFPNPTDSIINITIPEQVNKTADIKIFSATGKEVMSQKNYGDSNKVSLDVSSLSSGIYLYKVENHTGKFIKK